MKRRITWAVACLSAIVWIFLTPVLVCGPLDALFIQKSSGWALTDHGCFRMDMEFGGLAEKQQLWLIAGLMIPGQILLVVSFAKFFAKNHAIRARWLSSRRDA